MDRKSFLNLTAKSLIGGTMFSMGCSDLLNQSNPNTLTPDSFYSDASEAKAAVTSIYQVFGSPPDNIYWRQEAINFMADTFNLSFDVPANTSQAQFTFTSTNKNVTNLWNLNYRGIFRANQAIINIPKVSNFKNKEDIRSRLMGEAKFLRAYFHFSLLASWRKVPLRISIPESNADYPKASAPRKDVWMQIEKDLQDAVNNLPESYEDANKARIKKGAALAYLGKTYLYQQKWEQAASAFQQLIDTNNYSLLENFWDNFADGNEFSKESILEANYSSDTYGGVSFSSTRNHVSGPSEAGGWDQYFPSRFTPQEMTKEKTKDGKLDPRVNATLVWNGGNEKYWGKTYEELFGPNSDVLYWKKYSGAEYDHGIDNDFDKNWRILRYADVLLMHAEALTKMGNSGKAINFINQVRDRANLSAIPSSMSKNDVLKEIEHQRICELADEGAYRWFDLVRWGGNITQTMNVKEVLQAHGKPGIGNFVVGKHEYYPIPLSELQSNSAIEQDPAW